MSAVGSALTNTTMPPKLKTAGKSTATAAAAASTTAGNDPAAFPNANDVELMSYHGLVERKRRIDERLDYISVPDVSKKRSKPSGSGGKRSDRSSPVASSKESGPTVNEGEVPFTPKTDTHWDFVMKGKEQKPSNDFISFFVLSVSILSFLQKK